MTPPPNRMCDTPEPNAARINNEACAIGCFIFDFFSQNVSFRPDSHYFIFLMKFGGRYSLFKPIL